MQNTGERNEEERRKKQTNKQKKKRKKGKGERKRSCIIRNAIDALKLGYWFRDAFRFYTVG